MALQDVVFSQGDNQNFIVEQNRGNVGTITDVLSEGGSNPGMQCVELPEKTGGGGGNIFIHLE